MKSSSIHLITSPGRLRYHGTYSLRCPFDSVLKYPNRRSMSIRTFCVRLYSGCSSSAASSFPVRSLPLCSMLMYQVWWLIPAQMISTSSLGSPSVSAIIVCRPSTPWHSPTLRTPVYSFTDHMFITIGFAWLTNRQSGAATSPMSSQNSSTTGMFRCPYMIPPADSVSPTH